MKKKTTYLFVFLVLTIFTITAQADISQYTGTLSVQSGDSYAHTYIWNDAELDMTGGSLQSLDMLNSSTADISGGNITEGVYAWDNSTVDISDGFIGWNLDASDLSVVNLYGGVITDWLYATDSSVVNIFGYGFNYDSEAGDWNGGQLTGFWLDDSPFTIDLLDNIDIDSTYNDHVNLVPEPGSLLLIGVGGLFLRRKRN